MEALGRSVEVRGGLGYQKEVAGSPGHIGIDDGRHGYLHTPARNSASLAAIRRERERAKAEEVQGLL
jgi:hypothetical protein